MERLTNDNFLVYCAKFYDHPSFYSTEEFLEDIGRIKYIKKNLSRYRETGELKERLILNHIITLHNCFGVHLSRILFLKMEDQFYMIKPFLILINALPQRIYNVGSNNVINTDDIPLDMNIVDKLRVINND